MIKTLKYKEWERNAGKGGKEIKAQKSKGRRGVRDENMK
jgi:hypothetical protein